MAKAKVEAVKVKEEKELLIRVEYYRDVNPEKPTAYQTFKNRMGLIDGELDYWKTVVLDSVTFMELSARLQAQFILNPGTKEPRQWFASSTEALEQQLLVRFAAFPINVVVLAHLNEEKDEVNGGFVRNLKAPGRMSKGTGAGYMEVYKPFVGKDGEEDVYALQTRTDKLFACASQIDAPNPCLAEYEALWENWKGPQVPIHVLAYSDWGTGKSSFAATFPAPMLVWCFDAYGKDFPYLKKGSTVEQGEEEWGLKYTHVYAT